MAQYFATVARGLEALAAQELQDLGAAGVKPGFCGVSFEGDRALLYRINLWSRLAFRVLVPLGTFPCQDSDDLYQAVQSIDWQPYLSSHHTLAVDATGKSRRLNHSHFTALQVKNAIVDQQQQQWGDRSTVDPRRPDVRVNVHVAEGEVVVSLDSSGRSLHRRGYRAAVGAAPLKESLAAALIQLSDWTPDLPLLDPLCGSGTLPLEAALIGLGIAPGLFGADFGFQYWPDYDPGLWQQLWREAEETRRERLIAPIWGCDRNPEVVEQAQANAHLCGLGQQVQFFQQSLHALEPPAERGVLVCNPPYGERIGRGQDLGRFYQQLGTVLKQRFTGWTAYILSGNRELGRTIGLRSAQRIPVRNGTIACQWMKYELY